MLDDHSPRESAYHPGKVRVRMWQELPRSICAALVTSFEIWFPLWDCFLWSPHWKVRSLWKANPLCWDISPLIQFLYWTAYFRTKESAWLWSHSIAREMLDKASISCPYSVMFWYLPFSGYICLSFPLSPSALFSTSLLPNTFCSQQNMKTHLSPLDNSTDNQENTFQYDGVSGRMNV